MRFSVIFVSVNMAASISVVSQGQALADNGIGSCSTADFLKSSLTDLKLDTAKLDTNAAKINNFNKPVSAGVSSLSTPRAVAARTALGTATGGASLRPFVPNRKLPSARDLQVQQAQLDTSCHYQSGSQDRVVSASVPPLSGAVSQYNQYYQAADSAYDSVAVSARAHRAVKTQKKQAVSRTYQQAARAIQEAPANFAQRVLPGQAPAIPGMVGMPCAGQSVQSMNAVVSNAAASAGASQNFGQEAPLSPPKLTPQQQQEMDRLVNLSCAQAGSSNAQSETREDLYARVGPPPFPLNLIPESALKEFVQGSRHQHPTSLAARSNPQSFGSWHGNQAGGPASGLPTAGFKSYANSIQGFGNYRKASHGAIGTQHIVASAPGAQNSNNQKSSTLIAKKKSGSSKKSKAAEVAQFIPEGAVQVRSSIAHTPVLSYPPYRSDLEISK